MSANVLIAICFVYGIVLFALAYFADRAASRGLSRWLRSPLTYTLSLSVYCTAWTFYGAVGSAARNGMEFLAIYLGPSIAFIGWWVIIRKMVRIGRTQNITSIADFLSSRFGKSNTIAVIATVIVLAAITPYIALQLQSISKSFQIFVPNDTRVGGYQGVAFVSATGLAFFAILFGTRTTNVNERQNGVVIAIAFESIVKLVAIMSVGVFAMFFVGAGDVFALPEASQLLEIPIFTSRWVALVSVSFMSVLVLPRMFHVLVTENTSERHLFVASWAFPLYLFLINIFVLPIAIVGLNLLGSGADPDYFLITLPFQSGQTGLALLAFLGGFSAATSMIIMSSIAVSIMISNHIAMPIWLRARGKTNETADVQGALLASRRFSITIVMLLGYAYYEIAGGRTSLASIGIIAFAGVAQLFPSLMAALFWRGANRNGAAIGMILGGLTWIYTLYLPSIGADRGTMDAIITNGPWGVLWLAPQKLFGSDITDPFVHSLFWSIFLNTLGLVLGSLLSSQRPIENLLSNQFVGALNPRQQMSLLQRNLDTRIEDFHFLSERVLGQAKTEALFHTIAESQGLADELPIVTDDFIEKLERAFSGVVGGAAAHTLISQLTGARTVPVIETIKLADETVQNIEYAKALEEQAKQIEVGAQALREANATLVALDAQKDAFLSQVSHELRTPMTAIRSFTEILRDDPDLSAEERQKLLSIISEENLRLTNMLDEILDLSYLESGRVKMSRQTVLIREVIEQSIRVTESVWKGSNVNILKDFPERYLWALCDYNRMSQVFINLITNAVKYSEVEAPELKITLRKRGQMITIDFADNGQGVPRGDRAKIFEKFSRGGKKDIAGSAGLGLAISREIMENHGGSLDLITTIQGAKFRASIPLHHSSE